MRSSRGGYPEAPTPDLPNGIPRGRKAVRMLRFNELEGVEEKKAYRKLYVVTALVLLICFMGQVLISADADNMSCAILALVGSMAVTIAMIRPANMRYRPLSSWMVLLFAGANLAGPLLAKTLEFEPLTYNLTLPVTSFLYSVLGGMSFVVGHYLYSKISALNRARRTMTMKIMRPMGLFREPTVKQMWIMGFAGVLCMMYIYIIAGKNAEETGGIFAKFLAGIIPFAYAPFLQVFSFMYKERAKISRRTAITLSLYFVFILALALARNSRATFAIPLATGGLCVIIGVLSGRLPRNFLRPRVLVPALLVGVFLMPMVTNLAIAMQIVRSQKGKVSGVELLQLSLAKYQDTQAIEEFVIERAEATTGWDERYVHNIILGRFIYTKFHDNDFAITRHLGETEREKFSAFCFAHSLVFLPDPVINFFGIPIDKTQTTSISEGDELYYLYTGQGLGGFRGSSLLADGEFIFGEVFLLMLVVVCMPVFFLVDMLTIPLMTQRKSGDGELISYREIQFSPAALMNLFYLLYYTLSNSSMTDYIPFVFRGFPQLVIMYSFLVWLARLATRERGNDKDLVRSQATKPASAAS